MFIVKEDKLGEARIVFNNSNVNIYIEGKRHLGAFIGSNECREEYEKDLVNDWNNQLYLLSSIAESQPQAAYSAFVSGFKSKSNYFMRTISGYSSISRSIGRNSQKQIHSSDNRAAHLQQ